ncbi:MAG TPA: hypothetical protein VKY31_09420 [Terriglobia bacterium]|nr:hypothetical protein [Terriglobia bacterium]
MKTDWKIQIYDSSIFEPDPDEQDYHIMLEEKTTATGSPPPERKPRKRIRSAKAAQESAEPGQAGQAGQAG